jgi:hypothetical protein
MTNIMKARALSGVCGRVQNLRTKRARTEGKLFLETSYHPCGFSPFLGKLRTQRIDDHWLFDKGKHEAAISSVFDGSPKVRSSQKVCK